MPDPDAFYAQPASFPNRNPGTLLDSRQVTYAYDGASMPNTAFQLKYVSRDIHGNPIAAIATVVEPTMPFKNGPQPLLSVQYYTNSLGLQCAPSHSLTGSSANPTANTEGSFPVMGLAEGMTLVFPDHLGPQSEYLVGETSAYITLDGIRAALKFQPLGLNAQTPVGLEGYSGGSTATNYAVSFLQSYAPEINVVGVATGGTLSNTHNVLANFNSGDGNVLFSLALSVMFGINRAYPALLTPVLNAKGVTAGNALKDGCEGNTAAGQAGTANNPMGSFDDYVTTKDFIDDPAVDAILAKQADLPVPGHAFPKNVPYYIYQSQVDQYVNVADTNKLVGTLCANGEHIAYYVGAQGEHIAFDETMAPTVFSYFLSKFSGMSEIVPPGTTTCN